MLVHCEAFKWVVKPILICHEKWTNENQIAISNIVVHTRSYMYHDLTWTIEFIYLLVYINICRDVWYFHPINDYKRFTIYTYIYMSTETWCAGHNIFIEYNFVGLSLTIKHTCHQTSNISHTLVGNKLPDHSDVVGASPVSAASTTSSFST